MERVREVLGDVARLLEPSTELSTFPALKQGFLGIFWDLLPTIASGRAITHPQQDHKSFSHAALPVPTCSKPAVAELAFSRPRETRGLVQGGGKAEIRLQARGV